MNERAWNKVLACLLLLAACLGVSAAGQAAPFEAEPGVDARPNVLFIAVDDLNDWVGVLGGHPQVRTPNVDRLARRGVLFSRAYPAAPACNPSRAALLTGKRPSSTGVYNNDQPWRPVMPSVVTLPQHFRAAGYHVAAGGKIYHGGFNDRASWDTYYNPPPGSPPSGRPLNGMGNASHFDWGPLETPDEAMPDYKLTQWADSYLTQTHDRPFFLAVGLTRPHLPWYVPRKYFDRYPLASIQVPAVNPDDLDDVPAVGKKFARRNEHRKVVESGNWQRAVQGYLASISFADECIGRLLDALDRSRYADNTVIVFWGDHGWNLGEKQHWRKFALWEDTNRLPLVIADPRAERVGLTSGRPVNLVDLYPTLIELCGLPPQSGLEGQSLGPLLRNPLTSWERPSLTTHERGNHAIRSERWRYIRYADGSEELYDHDADPNEWKNVAGRPEHRGVKQELAAWLPTQDAPDAPKEGGGDND